MNAIADKMKGKAKSFFKDLLIVEKRRRRNTRVKRTKVRKDRE